MPQMDRLMAPVPAPNSDADGFTTVTHTMLNGAGWFEVTMTHKLGLGKHDRLYSISTAFKTDCFLIVMAYPYCGVMA